MSETTVAALLFLGRYRQKRDWIWQIDVLATQFWDWDFLIADLQKAILAKNSYEVWQFLKEGSAVGNFCANTQF